MPIYEYRCNSCGKELEKIRKISDPPLVDCPLCGEASLVKLVSASSFRLKGSGWYETDFKTGAKKNGAAQPDSSSGSGSIAVPPPADKKESAKVETSSDSKKTKTPDAKSGGKSVA